jgi:hypothetical protein
MRGTSGAAFEKHRRFPMSPRQGRPEGTASCWLPAGVDGELNPADRRMDASAGAGHDRETDVAGTATVYETVSATGRVGAHLNSATDRARIVAAAGDRRRSRRATARSRCRQRRADR